jgi:TRAP-type C4-dicarboxylate transport system permease small subunit
MTAPRLRPARFCPYDRAVANDDSPAPGALPTATAVAGADDVGPPADPHAPVEEPAAARALRQVDEAIGAGERLVISVIFLFLICIGVYRTWADVVWNERPLWAVEGIRVSVFAIAMLGAAFATHHKRNFNLDLLSKLFAPRGKAVLRVALNLVGVGAAALLCYGGWLVKKTISMEKEYDLVPKWVIGWFIPIAAGLIIVHLLLHVAIELTYLARGKAAPEPEQAVA